MLLGWKLQINITVSKACRWLMPLSKLYRATATKIKRVWQMRSTAMPRRKSHSRSSDIVGGCRCVSVHDWLAGNIHQGGETQVFTRVDTVSLRVCLGSW